MPNETELFLTVKEVAEVLQVTDRSVANYLKRGLPYIKVGGIVRVHSADLRSWMLSHRRTNLSPLTREHLEVLHGEISKVASKRKKCPTRRETFSLF